MSSKKYCVEINNKGKVSYLIYRDRTAWAKRTAQKHLREWLATHGIPARLVED
jgi:hypothetical protein